MHGSIDSFTDSNRYVRKSKSRLGKKGYLKGVIIDMAYDHLLIKNWDQFSKISLEDFINTFYTKAGRTVETYPGNARKFVEKLVESEYLTSYRCFDGLEAAFCRMDTRLSERLLQKESATGYLPTLKSKINGIEDDFLQFFPQLIQHLVLHTGTLPKQHWINSRHQGKNIMTKKAWK